jgi:pyrroline-5-carboxylate reductase
VISPRNEEKAAILKADFPDIIEIASSNDDVVRKSNVIFIGLLPAAAAEILPKLIFSEEQTVNHCN